MISRIVHFDDNYIKSLHITSQLTCTTKARMKFGLLYKAERNLKCMAALRGSISMIQLMT